MYLLTCFISFAAYGVGQDACKISRSLRAPDEAADRRKKVKLRASCRSGIYMQKDTCSVQRVYYFQQCTNGCEPVAVMEGCVWERWRGIVWWVMVRAIS